MKTHTFAAFTAAILMLALIGSAAACVPPCGAGEQYVPGHYGPYGHWEIGKCPGNHETDTCNQNHVGGGVWYHRHREYIPGACVAVSCPAIPCEEGFECVDNTCQPIPPEAITEMQSYYAPFTAGPCTAPARIVSLSEKDGRTYMASAAYMGFIDNLTISTYNEAGDSDIPYYQLNPFITSTSGIGIVSLSSGGAVAHSFEYAAIKDETSTPDGWQIRGELIDMSTGAVVDTQSTEGSDTCLHVMYTLSPSH